MFYLLRWMALAGMESRQSSTVWTTLPWGFREMGRQACLPSMLQRRRREWCAALRRLRHPHKKKSISTASIIYLIAVGAQSALKHLPVSGGIGSRKKSERSRSSPAINCTYPRTASSRARSYPKRSVRAPAVSWLCTAARAEHRVLTVYLARVQTPTDMQLSACGVASFGWDILVSRFALTMNEHWSKLWAGQLPP